MSRLFGGSSFPVRDGERVVHKAVIFRRDGEPDSLENIPALRVLRADDCGDAHAPAFVEGM